MSTRNICLLAAVLVPTFAQTPGRAPRTQAQPIYRITIVQRTTPAINYGHRSQPTKIDFKGTPLLPQARGEATVRNNNGATMVDAHFSNVPPPGRFGSQYLTYVVWSISPEGRAQSIGELVLNGSDKGHLVASTPMQAFALIVTAEPYYSVTQPSDVVVMENAIRPDTVGDVQQVNATYELLPRKEYTYNVSAPAPVSAGTAVSMPEYEALVASYEAKNAIEIASAAGADRYAPDKLNRAEQLFEQTKQIPRKTLSAEVVAKMREAAQLAEDARAISVERAKQEQLAQVRAQTEQTQKRAAAEQAAAEAARVQAQQDALRVQQDAERARQEAQQELARAQALAEQQARQQREAQQNAARAAQADRMMPHTPDNSREIRASLRQRLSNSGLQTLDTPRGLVVLIPNLLLESAPEAVRGRVASITSAASSYRGLRFAVEAHTDSGTSESASMRFTEELAAHVRDMLVARGIPVTSVTAAGYGSTRPTASNQTAVGRQQNRRVEVVISGEAIGNMPVWDQPYSLERRPLTR
jgi:outer membrane protein OmpA-like peptidoglycan-associated protein